MKPNDSMREYGFLLMIDANCILNLSSHIFYGFIGSEFDNQVLQRFELLVGPDLGNNNC